MLNLEQVKAKSASKLAGLLPVVREAGVKLIERCYARGVPIQITQGYRSIAEQDALYAQGRTTPGSIVTNARGGYSYHNFGVAIDFALLSPDGKSVYWDTKRDGDGDGVKDWNEVVEEAKKLGFEWGGDWKTFVDLPHFQLAFGLTIGQFRAGLRPTQAQINAAYLKIEAGEEKPKMTAEDANKIISMFLGPTYEAAKARGDKAGADEAHRLANELRKASGQKV